MWLHVSKCSLLGKWPGNHLARQNVCVNTGIGLAVSVGVVVAGDVHRGELWHGDAGHYELVGGLRGMVLGK